MDVRRPNDPFDETLPWGGHCDPPAPVQLDFAEIWYSAEDYARMRARQLAQSAMKVQMRRFSGSGQR